MFFSRFMPCVECGESLDQLADDEHQCSRQRWVAYQTFLLRDEVEYLEEGFRDFLSSAHGRFEQWWAFHQVRTSA